MSSCFRARAFALLSLAVVASAQYPKPYEVAYDIILDAGSTGTRMYLFMSELVPEDGEYVYKVTSKKIGKQKPGLSAYADKPDEAVKPLLKLFKAVQQDIQPSSRSKTTVSVLGTAGMRSIGEALAVPVYEAVRKGLLDAKEYVFPTDERLKLRTLSGTEEGTFSLLCVNFLAGRLNHMLVPTKKGREQKLLGILDLGGSSTQIAVPQAGSGQDLLNGAGVRSYAAYGMEQMRAKVDKRLHDKGIRYSPCYFKGFTEESNGMSGSGKASDCRRLLLDILDDARPECDIDAVECMPGIDRFAATAGGQGRQFFAVSGYLYVTDFASHWLKQMGSTSSAATSLLAAGNRPTPQELEVAADELCRSAWADIKAAHDGGAEAGAHRYTDSTKAPHRCLEVSYVVALLHHSYGFPKTERFITFEDEVDGNDVEWPLGALLHMKYSGVPKAAEKVELWEKDYATLFSDLDSDHDGLLAFEELGHGIESVHEGSPVTHEDTLAKQKHEDELEKLRAAFYLADADFDDKLNVAELVKVLDILKKAKEEEADKNKPKQEL